MKWLNKGIENIIKTFMYKFYLIQQDYSIHCSCKNVNKEPDPACKKCLGTGHKIRIKSVKGYSEDVMKSVRQSYTTEPIISTEYYILSKYPIERGNLIVDKNEALMIHEKEDLRSTEGKNVYQHCYAYRKKTNSTVFLNNFNELFERKGGEK